MDLESKIEREACALIYNNLGIASSKLVTPGDTGFPDRIIWVPGGRPLLMEFKRPGQEPRPKQVYQQQQLIKLGYHVENIDDKICALQAVISALETTQLSKEGHEILARAKSRCSVLGSRAR